MVNLGPRTGGDIMDNIERFVRRAEELRENNRVTDAEELIRDTLEDYEDSWQLWSELGQILIRKQDFGEAATAFLNAINLEPDAFWPWLYLGRAQRELGDYEAAIESTENALNVSNGKTELNLAYYNLACYYTLLGQKEEAMDYLRTALEQDESLRESARENSDLDPLRNEPGFEFLTES
jgi:tetratricopeptide (TPR) repeat protein